MAVRALLTSRNTNSSAGRCASHGAHCAGEEIPYVRQTGAVQGQRESSTEPHTKNVEMCFRTRGEGETTPVLCHPNLGERLTARRESGAVRTCGRLGHSSGPVYVHMDDTNPKIEQMELDALDSTHGSGSFCLGRKRSGRESAKIGATRIGRLVREKLPALRKEGPKHVRARHPLPGQARPDNALQ